MKETTSKTILYICDACDAEFVAPRVEADALPLVCPACSEAAAYPADISVAEDIPEDGHRGDEDAEDSGYTDE